MLRFTPIKQTFEAKIKPEGAPTESGGQLETRGRLAGKWIAEGKGNGSGVWNASQYLDRGLALRAEDVLASS